MLVFQLFFALFLGFLPEVTFSSLPSFLAWARGACVFLVAHFLYFSFLLGFLPEVGAPGARQSFVFFGGFQEAFPDFSKLAHALAPFCHGSPGLCAWGALPGVSNSIIFFFCVGAWGALPGVTPGTQVGELLAQGELVKLLSDLF